MSRTVSLGICVLCCLVVALICEALEFDQPTTGTKHSRPPSTPATVKNGPKMLEYVPGHLQAGDDDGEHRGHQHDKRDTMPRGPSLEDILQQQWPEWPPVNLRGRRLPLYAEEPRFILLRQPTPQQQHHSSPSFSFIPQRGRKSDPLLSSLAKRELSIKQMLEGGDYFVPNRGKKGSAGISKKVKFDDILGSDELFIPNRGKKELLELFGGGRSLNDLQPYYYNKKNVLTAIQNVGSKNDGTAEGAELFYPTRGKKANILENLAQNQDTFFSSRGKRLPIAWNLLNHDDDPWEYLTAATADDSSSSSSSSYDADFALDRYQTNKIIA